MRPTILLFLFLALLATACGGGGDAVPTAAPTVPAESLGNGGEGGASPRVDASTSIPPTWTPQSPAVQVTSVPASEDEPAPTTSVDGDVYVVQAGDTLAEIAIRFAVDLDALAEVNGIQNIDHIEVGQELVIPQS